MSGATSPAGLTVKENVLPQGIAKRAAIAELENEAKLQPEEQGGVRFQGYGRLLRSQGLRFQGYARLLTLSRSHGKTA